ncbi:MAG: TonB-dependent receptor [Gammaproteobacteria bacterium]
MGDNRISFATHTILLTLLTGLWAAGAPAQGGLEELIVTAQKKEQNIRDVPIAIGTLNKDNFNATLSAGADIRALSARLPSLLVESSNGRLIPRFYIRGLGNIDFDSNASQPVSFVYDDVVLESPAAKAFPLFDIERVEVLRGPQGSLFGRNTTAGIIKFDSRRPTAETTGYFAASYGRFSQRTMEGAIGGTLSAAHELTGRASFFYNALSNWVDNLADGYETRNQLGGFNDHAVRVQLQWQPDDRFNALFNIHGRVMRDGTPTLFRANVIQQGSNDLVTGFARDEVFMDAADRHEQEQNQYGVIGTLSYDFDNVKLTSITGFHTVTKNFSQGDVDGGFGAVYARPTGPGPGIPFDSETRDALTDHEQFTWELRLSADRQNGGGWQAGFYYFTEEVQIDTSNFETLPPPGVAAGTIDGFVRQAQDTDAWAVFGTLEYPFGDRWMVTVGLRYSDDDKQLTAQRTLSPLQSQSPIGPLEADTGDQIVTGDASVTYALNDTVNLYARFARGHRAPSIQGRLLFQDSISVADTEKNHSFEGGFKGEFLDRRLRLNASGFYYRISDQQLTRIGGTGNLNTLINADATTGYGFEMEFEYIPADNWSFTGGASFNHTEIDDPDLTINGCGSAACTVIDPPAPNPDNVAAGVYFIDGNPLYNAPRWIANWSVRYVHPFAGGEFYVHSDWAYHSAINFTLYESLEYGDDGLLEGGARVGYNSGDGKYDIAVFGRNILNDESLVGTIDFNNLTGFVNNPPMWGVEVRVNWE